MKRAGLIIILIIWALHPIIAQENTPVYHPIDKTEWEKTVKGYDYYEKGEQKKEIDFEPDINIPEDNTSTGDISLVTKTLLFVAAAVLLIFILIMIFGKGIRVNTKVVNTPIQVLEELDERPMESDLERFLRESLERRDFRLAIRIYYLMVLKTLHEKNAITWKNDNTNMDYLLCLRSHPQYELLSKNTYVFEYIWYGNQNLTENGYKRISPSFTQLLNQIQQKG